MRGCLWWISRILNYQELWSSARLKSSHLSLSSSELFLLDLLQGNFVLYEFICRPSFQMLLMNKTLVFLSGTFKVSVLG